MPWRPSVSGPHRLVLVPAGLRARWFTCFPLLLAEGAVLNVKTKGGVLALKVRLQGRCGFRGPVLKDGAVFLTVTEGKPCKSNVVTFSPVLNNVIPAPTLSYQKYLRPFICTWVCVFNVIKY